MHAAARGLAARPEVRQRRRAVEIGDAPRRRGSARPARPGSQSRVGSRPAVRHASQIVGKRLGKSSIIVASSHRWSAPVAAIVLVDRAGDDVARREVGERVHAGHERDALAVAQHAPFAAQRLGEQRPRHRRVVQRGRMELHELEVGARDAGLQRERDAVAGRQRRVGGDREALADTAGREHDVGGAHELDLAVGSSAITPAQRPSSTSSSIANQPLADLDRRPRSTAATSARSISAPVASPPACTTRASEWPPSRASCSVVAVGAGLGVELRAERRELADPVGTFGHEHLHRVDVAQAGAGGERVGEVQLRTSRARPAPPRRRPARTASPRATARPS